MLGHFSHLFKTQSDRQTCSPISLLSKRCIILIPSRSSNRRDFVSNSLFSVPVEGQHWLLCVSIWHKFFMHVHGKNPGRDVKSQKYLSYKSISNNAINDLLEKNIQQIYLTCWMFFQALATTSMALRSCGFGNSLITLGKKNFKKQFISLNNWYLIEYFIQS